ncbi:MAG: thioredoxin domain-containing protein [Bryobacteraceae bacterium]|jgi:protein-disulfide isomerase
MKLVALALAAALPVLAASLDADKSKIMGNPNAPVGIEVYSDFECPACRTFHIETLPQLIKDYVVPGKVCIIAREFPLNIPEHKYSREAANYATAAARVGKYEAVADALFKTQTTWAASGKVWETVASVLTAAEQKKVQALAKDPGVASEVQSDVERGQSAGINQTPTAIVMRGSKQYPLSGYALKYDLLTTLLNDLLK